MSRVRTSLPDIRGLVALIAVGCLGQKGEPEPGTEIVDTGTAPIEPFEGVPCPDTGLAPFPVNFVVLTTSTAPNVPAALHTVEDTVEPIDSIYGPYTGDAVFDSGEIDVLNGEFRSDVDEDGISEQVCAENGVDCVSFVYGGHAFNNQLVGIDPSCDDLLAFGDPEDYNCLSVDFETAVNACEDQHVVRDKAINFYVYDLQGDTDSHGRFNCSGDSNDCHPFVVLDFKRLPHAYDAGEEHEMGHAFDLAHVCDPLTDEAESSNIMQGGNCDDQMGGYFPNGQRDIKFTRLQVDQIITKARSITNAWCNADDAARYLVQGDPPCQAGSGQFTLLQREFADRNHDGIGRADLVPVLLSGQHLSPRAWVTSLRLVSRGDYTSVFATRDRRELDWSNHDTVPAADVLTLSTLGALVNVPLGQVHAGTRWATSGFDVTQPGYAPPVVEMSWSCQIPPTGSPAVTLSRPSGYRLPVSALGAVGSSQEVIVRPNFSAGWVWVELRGRPRDATRVRLVPRQNGKHRFVVDTFGVSLTADVVLQGQQLRLDVLGGTVAGAPVAPSTRLLSPL